MLVQVHFTSTDGYPAVSPHVQGDFMIGHDAVFASFVDRNYDEHLGDMRKQCTWGMDAEAEIMGAAPLFGINIRVFY